MLIFWVPVWARWEGEMQLVNYNLGMNFFRCRHVELRCNKTVLKNLAQPTQDQAGRTCNCRKKDKCPLEGNCLSKGIVYQAKATSESKTRRCRSTRKCTRTTQNLANTSGRVKVNSNTTPSNGRSLPRRDPTQM